MRKNLSRINDTNAVLENKNRYISPRGWELDHGYSRDRKITSGNNIKTQTITRVTETRGHDKKQCSCL